ncbi:MAG TPA: class I SAM-dependent methyltransferase [Anaerolineae bacterium]|nr:class I SAM-dependent methyltransferase [Anaerolineae bacterium]
MGIYEKYAEVYDRSGQIAFTLLMIPYLDRVLERHGFAGESALDLACGTGTMALAMAEKGWRVQGLDASAAMLAQARRKAREAGARVEFMQGDMRHFALPEPVDLVTCFYDSLNYLLTLDDLSKAFRCVAAALKPGGLFVFDMNTPWGLAHVGEENSYFYQDDEVAVEMRSSYDQSAGRATVIIAGSIRRGELRESFVEVHIEQGYSEGEIAAALREAGFRVEGRYDCFTLEEPGPECGRVLWVARKGGEET